MMIPGIMAQRRRSPVSGGYLDTISPAPRVAYSLRKIISTATLAIRVRRSSDNAEQDIGFAGDALDTAALATFVGANSAFVTTFYDQTATGINLTQATAAAQPRIVNTGVYDGAAVFDGINDWMSSSAVITYGSGYASAYMKASISNQTGPFIILESSANYNFSDATFLWFMQDGKHSVAHNKDKVEPYQKEFLIPDSAALRNLTPRWQMAVADATLPQIRLRAAGVDIAPSGGTGPAVIPPANYSAQTLYLGSRGGSIYFSPIQIHTMAIYNADTDASVAAIEAVVGA